MKTTRRELLPAALFAGLRQQQAARPNILWIIGDDLGPELSCYGHPLTNTPHIDRLARLGVRFTNCHSTAPVCSSSRSAFQTGLYQTTTGTHHHRSHRQDSYVLPAPARLLSHTLHDHGYFTCNLTPASSSRIATGKTDFNFKADRPFDGDHWRQRANNQPFFAQVCLLPPHKGAAFPQARRRPQLVDPARVSLPPYYPDHPVIRDEFANYLDAVQLADDQVGTVLAELERDSLLDSTVVFVFGDNGRCLLRGKQWLYETGTHVPLVIHWPGQVKPGSLRPDLCTLLDVSATTLAAAGVDPGYRLHGRSLVGPRGKPPGAIFTARDRCGVAVDHIRAIRTQRFRLIRNFRPDRPYSQHNPYILTQYPTFSVMRELHQQRRLNPIQDAFFATRKPELELYDLQADPHEVNNLAGQSSHRKVQQQLLSRLGQWQSATCDAGGKPEDPDELEQARKEDTTSPAARPR